MAETRVELAWQGDAVLKALQAGEDEALFRAGEVMLERAKGRVPKRTGRLQKSGYVATHKKSSYVKKRGYKREKRPERPGVVAVGFAAIHSHLIEFGTVKAASRPYLRPTLDELREQIGGTIAAGMAGELQKRVKK